MTTFPPSPHQTGEQLKGTQFASIPEGTISVEAVLDGMVTALPRSETPAGSAEEIKNGRVRDNWVGSRGAFVEVSAKPDSNRVLLIATFLREGRESSLVRVTSSGIHSLFDLGGSWEAFTGDTPTGVVRLDETQFLNKMYIVSHSDQVIQVDVDSKEATEIEGSPRASHIAAYADRLVVANLLASEGGTRPTRIKWSGRLNATEWDATVDLTAGETDLASSPSDTGDDIVGLEALSDVLVIIREGSIWHAERQPIGSAPFRFRSVIEGQGCDMPHTIQKVSGDPVGQAQTQRAGNQLIFADYRTKGVWTYRPGVRPRRISQQIDDQLFDDLVSAEWSQAGYDPFNQEYHLGLATDSGDPQNISKVWVYSLRHNAWTYDDGPDLSTIGQVVIPVDITTIDELTGTIDGLTGTIDSLSDESVTHPEAMRGTVTGEVLTEDRTVRDDYDGTSFEFLFQSPNVGSVESRRNLQRLVARVKSALGGNYTIELSNDNSSWRKSISKAISASGLIQKASHRNNGLDGDDLWWRIRTSDADLQLFNYLVKMLEKGLLRND